MEKKNVLSPSAGLLCKLGSVVVHTEEMFSMQGHEFDRAALLNLLGDPEIQEWIKGMDSLAMLPKKRTMEDLKLSMQKRKRK